MAAPTNNDLTGLPVRVPKMAELVSQQLRRRIIRGELAEGEALPSEAALMAQFAVSRPTLREAYRVLESEGLISVRRGAHGGARVQVPNGDVAARYAGLILEFRETTLEDVYVARGVIEPPCAAMLARRRTKADIERLRSSLEEARPLLDDPHAMIRVHNEFHVLMVELAGNQTMAVLNGMLSHIIDRSSFRHIAEEAGTPTNLRSMHKGFRAHERLVDLVEQRSAEEAEELWRRHVVEAQSHLLSGSHLKTVLDLME